MGVAKARLVQDLNIRQLIQDLAAAWGDDESVVLQYVADLFEKDYLHRSEEGVSFFYIHRLEATNTTGSVSCHPVRLPVSGGGTWIAKSFRKIARDPPDWEGKEAFVYVFAGEIREKFGAKSPSYRQLKELFPSSQGSLFKIPLREIYADKDDVVQLLSDNSLPIPHAWTGTEASETGLTQADRSRGGRQRKYNSGLQEAICQIREEIEKEGNRLTLSTLIDWLERNVVEYHSYSFQPEIPDCHDLYLDGDELSWVDRNGIGKHIKLKTLERYIRRAKESKKA